MMNIEKLNQWLALIGNIGVIAGLVFLAIQIQQEADATKAQTRDSISNQTSSLLVAIASNPELLTAWGKGMRGEFEDLPELQSVSDEFLAYVMSMTAIMRTWENEWYQFQQGLFEEEEFEPRKEIWRINWGSQSFRAIWETRKSILSRDFVQAFEEAVAI